MPSCMLSDTPYTREFADTPLATPYIQEFACMPFALPFALEFGGMLSGMPYARGFAGMPSGMPFVLPLEFLPLPATPCVLLFSLRELSSR